MTDPEMDARMLERAVGLAEAFVGFTAPNPAVGAVCARDGRILGEGVHVRAGKPHAEVNCLNACIEDPAEATLYVTLEPCSTAGRTPPCCDLIRAKRLGRVVIGCLDPNPRHAGRAVGILRAAGIDVTVAEGPIADRCRALIAPFAKAVTEGLPYLRLKLALTLDGFIADASGTSRWITGPEARDWVQRLRAKVDAVMVGAGTVRADHPSLQPRVGEFAAGKPTDVTGNITHGLLSPANAIVSGLPSPLVGTVPSTRHLPSLSSPNPLKWRVLVDRSTPPAAEDVDAHTLVATRDLGYDGHDLRAMLCALCAKGVNDVLCEGGGTLGGALLDAGLVDELNLFYAPKILGDPQARRGLGITPRPLSAALAFEPFDRQTLGSDTLLRLARPSFKK